MKNFFLVLLFFSLSVSAQKKTNKIDTVKQSSNQGAPLADTAQLNPEEIFVWTDEMPQFQGGTSLEAYVQSHLQSPKCALGKGTVYVSFIVMKDGSVDKVKIAKGIPACPEYEKEAMRIIKSLPAFKPGKFHGKVVAVMYNLPIKFEH